MAVQNSEMKMKIGADTSDFHNKIKGAKSALSDFNKTSTNALQSLGDAFGVNVRQIETLGNAVKGFGIELGKSGSEGVKAFGNVVAAIGKASTAIAGLGLAAAIASFKALNNEASAFKNTIAGANIELQTKAYLDTYTQVMHDMQTETGRGVAQGLAKIKEVWGGFKSQISAHGTAMITNLFGLTDISWQDVDDQAASAIKNANRAKEIQGEIFNIQRQQKQNEIEIAEIDAKIAEARELSADPLATAEQKLAAINQATALLSQKYALQIPLQQRLADLINEKNSLSSSSVADEDAAIDAVKQVNALRTAQSMEMRKLLKSQGTLSKEVAAERADVERIAQMRKELAALDLQIASQTKTGTATTAQNGGLAGERPKDTAKDFKDIGREIETSIASATDLASTMIGSLVGDLATGGNAWGNFADAAVSAFGDMAISIGKMAIATGVASKGIKKALELKPELAIAAGAALVALGSAVKAGLGNISSGNYSSGTNVASSAAFGASASGGGYATSTLNVNVTGKLVANGSTLQAVLDNESKRKNATT